MHLSAIAAIVESATRYPLVGIRQDTHYILVDIGFIAPNGHASPIVPFIVSLTQLTDATDGPEYLRILTREACDKLERFLPQVQVHAC
jgi:hypothetical protein